MAERLNSDESGFDVLADVLETLRFRGSIFFHSELAAPWGMSLSEAQTPRFHIALSGDCFVGTGKEQAVEVGEMDIVMLASGSSHWIADQPGRELVLSERAAEACELNNPLFQAGEITNRLMCGLVRFDQQADHPFFDPLPEILHFPRLEERGPVWMTVSLIDAELRRVAAPGGPIVDRLTEVLVLQLLNHHINKADEQTGFLAALRDRRIRQALALIHREPAFDWSLSSLGERIGMSRATLNRHFQETVGVAPMSYVADWRLMKAYNLVRYTGTSFEQIAETVGFASARTLSRAFQRRYGCTPNGLRSGEA